MKMIHAIILALFFVFYSVTAFSAGRNPVGIVKIVSGEAVVLRRGYQFPDGEYLKATTGMRLYQRDVIKTESEGSIGLIFKDGTIISMGPKTIFVIEDFQFEPVDKKLSFVTRMFRGTVSFISGQIAKLAPNSVHLRIPAATIGMRGTHILVKIPEK